MLALPKGHIYQLEYDAQWIQDDLWHHMKMRPNEYLNRPAVLIYADDRSKYEIFVPLRKMKVNKIEVLGDVVVLHLELGDFIYRSQHKLDKTRTLKDELETLFGKQTLPGTPLNKLILIGEKVRTLQEVEYGSDIPSWRETIDAIHKEQCQAFKDSLFFYIPVEEMEALSQLHADEIEAVYRCNAGKKFSFKVYYYLPNYQAFGTDAERRTIHCETSSDVIKILVPNDLVLSKYGSGQLSFRSGQAVEGVERCTIFFEGIKEPFKAPAPKITVEVIGKARRTYALGAATTGLAGAALGSFGAMATNLSSWKIGLILTGIFGLFYLGGWLYVRNRTL
jgi:hypothetical protein